MVSTARESVCAGEDRQAEVIGREPVVPQRRAHDRLETRPRLVRGTYLSPSPIHHSYYVQADDLRAQIAARSQDGTGAGAPAFDARSDLDLPLDPEDDGIRIGSYRRVPRDVRSPYLSTHCILISV